MKKYFLMFIFLSSSVFAQELYENGHIIDSDGNKIEVQIEVSTLNKYPDTILYRKNSNSQIQYGTPQNLISFQVSDYKFITFSGLIDLNENPDTNSEPDLNKRSIFIRQEIDGYFDLFEYKTGDKSIYLFRKNDQIPTQLYSIEFIRTDGITSFNRIYRNQLSEAFDCEDFSDSKFSNLKYELEHLTSFFKLENSCNGVDQIEYNVSSFFSPRYLNIGLSFGAVKYSIASTNSVQELKYSAFKDVSFPNIAAELEYLIPSLKNRLAILARIDYKNFKDSDITTIEGRRDTAQLSFQTLETSIGARWYFNRSNTFKVFTDISYSKGLAVGDGVTIDYQSKRNFEEPKFPSHFTLGAGVMIKNRFVLDARLEYLDKRFSKVDSQEDVDISVLTINFKYLLKSYYK